MQNDGEADKDGRRAGPSQDGAPPTLDEQERLYSAAAQFAGLAPWGWMDGADLFGVQDSASGLIGYCSVMGELGEVFGLALYPGARGYGCYQRTILDTGEPVDFETVVSQYSLLASFEDRDALDTHDLAAIKDLSLRFRGRNAWPLFRSYRPGYVPWYLVGWEVRLLTAALEQALEVSSRVAEGLDLLEHEHESLILVRVQGAKDDWVDTWQSVPELPQPAATPVPDAARLRRTAESLPMRPAVWEAGLVYLPTVVEERGSRPYYPRTWLFADSETGVVGGIDLLLPQTTEADLQEAFIGQLEQGGFCPAELCVTQEEAFQLLGPISEALQIRLRRSSLLPALNAAKQSLIGYFQG